MVFHNIFHSSLHRPLVLFKNNLLCTYERIGGLSHKAFKCQTGTQLLYISLHAESVFNFLPAPTVDTNYC